MNVEEQLANAEDLLRQRNLVAARETFEAAQAGGADADRCSGSLWLTHVLLGDFEAAWRER